MNAKRQFPDESVVNSSSSVIVGGLVLAFGAVLLAVGLTQATHLKGLFYRHRSTWGASFRVIESTAVFLSCWLLLSGVFMVMAGSIREIENFREDAQLRAGVLVTTAIVLLLVFVYAAKWQVEGSAQGGARRKPTTLYWFGVLSLFAAFVLAAVAASGVSAWTLPSQQKGTQLFLAPGLGLTAGTLLLLVFLSVEVGWSLDSRPDGCRVRPHDKDASHAYLDSTLPVFAAFTVSIMSMASSDPSLPFPLIAALVFSPKRRINLIAAGLCLLAVLVSSFIASR